MGGHLSSLAVADKIQRLTQR